MQELRQWYGERGREYDTRRPWLWPLLIVLAMASALVQPGLILAYTGSIIPGWLEDPLLYALPVLYLLLFWQLLAKLRWLRPASGQFPELDQRALQAGLKRLDLAMLARFCLPLLGPYMLSWELLMGPGILWGSLGHDYAQFTGVVTGYMAASTFFSLVMVLMRISVFILLLAIVSRLPWRLPLAVQFALVLLPSQLIFLLFTLRPLNRHQLLLWVGGFIPLEPLAAPRFEFFLYLLLLILLLAIHNLMPVRTLAARSRKVPGEVPAESNA